MRVAITGARGFIGRHLTRYLTERGCMVLCLGRNEGGGYVELDLHTGQQVKNTRYMREHLDGIEAVVHLASPQIESWTAPVAHYLGANVELTEEIFRGADPSSLKRVVFASSRLVYRRDLVSAAREDAVGVPDTTYGLSKIMGEQIVGYYASRLGLTGISLRLGQVFGSGFADRGVLGRFVRQARQEGVVKVFGSGTAKRDLVYVKDALSAIECALTRSVPSGAYNIGSGRGYSINELALAVSEVFFDGSHSICYVEVDEEDLSRYIMDCAKSKRYLGWEANWSLIEALRDMYSI